MICGVASPWLAYNALHSLFMFLGFELCLVLCFNGDPWVVWLIPCIFLIVFVVDAIRHRNAFCPYVIDKQGVRNHKIKILWEDVDRIELINTETASKRVRGRKIQRFSVCVGETVYGDLFDQSLQKCVFFPCSDKIIVKLRLWGRGKSRALDKFLEGFENEEDLASNFTQLKTWTWRMGRIE